jgi:PIN domain nuclease of toxin-antitoxin system
MRLLLDTAPFLWWITDSQSLSQRAREAIGNPDNEVLVSAVSSWEIVIKAQLGRLTFPEAIERFLPKQIVENGFQVLPIVLRHTLHVIKLADHHQDPFDRLLVAQAIVEGLTLISGDRQIAKYPARLMW